MTDSVGHLANLGFEKIAPNVMLSRKAWKSSGSVEGVCASRQCEQSAPSSNRCSSFDDFRVELAAFGKQGISVLNKTQNVGEWALLQYTETTDFQTAPFHALCAMTR